MQSMNSCIIKLQTQCNLMRLRKFTTYLVINDIHLQSTAAFCGGNIHMAQVGLGISDK